MRKVLILVYIAKAEIMRKVHIILVYIAKAEIMRYTSFWYTLQKLKS